MGSVKDVERLVRETEVDWKYGLVSTNIPERKRRGIYRSNHFHLFLESVR